MQAKRAPAKPCSFPSAAHTSPALLQQPEHHVAHIEDQARLLAVLLPGRLSCRTCRGCESGQGRVRFGVVDRHPRAAALMVEREREGRMGGDEPLTGWPRAPAARGCCRSWWPHLAHAAGGWECCASCRTSPRVCHAALIAPKSSSVDNGMPCRQTVLSCIVCACRACSHEQGQAQLPGLLRGRR